MCYKPTCFSGSTTLSSELTYSYYYTMNKHGPWKSINSNFHNTKQSAQLFTKVYLQILHDKIKQLVLRLTVSFSRQLQIPGKTETLNHQKVSIRLSQLQLAVLD